MLYPIFARIHVTVEITNTGSITVRTEESFETRVDNINIANVVVVAQ